MPSGAVNARFPCRELGDYMEEVKKVQKTWRKGKVESKGDSMPLWFRGQRSAKWDLRPRIYRHEYAEALESEIRLEFEGHGLQLATTNLNRTKWEWYFLMQHYGAPTRLLDWTGNPLAALYFAIADESIKDDVKNQDAAVWIFDPWRWNNLHFSGLSGPSLPGWKETEPFLPDLEDACNRERVRKRWPIAIEPPSIDRRLANQAARFLLFGKEKDLVKAMDRTKNEREKTPRLAYIVLAHEKLDSIRCELDDIGVNHRMLFPDLQGLGAHLSWEWKGFRKARHLY
ncbi:MAG: FRG domain-containing protein [Acidobacteriia bacterium]|nr:FRG domain-containing protein [Terriglobia bacterium]